MGSSLSFFALLVFAVAPVMLASQKVPWISGTIGFTVSVILAGAFAFLLRSYLPRVLSPNPDPDPAVISRVAFALLVLAWGPIAAYHLANSPFLNSLTLSAVMGSFWEELFPGSQIPFLLLLQLGVVVMSAGLTAISFWGIRSRLIREGAPLLSKGWRILLGLFAVYFGFIVVLILSGSIHK